MAILSISRDWGTEPSLVRITTTDNLAAITADGYLLTQEDEIDLINHGAFEWLETDAVLITYADGKNTFQRNAVTNTFELLNTGGGGGGSIAIPTLTDHIIVALDNLGNIGNILTNQNKTARFNGIIQSGLPAPGNPGAFYCYSSTGATGGRLELQANQNTNSANVSIENRSHAASTAYLIPDCGAPSADFLVSESPGIQHIASGGLQVDAGDITAVNMIAIGSFVSRVAAPGTGTLQLEHQADVNDFFVLIQNQNMDQNSTYTIPDIHQATGAFVVSQLPTLMKPFQRALIAGGDTSSVINDAFCSEGATVIGNFVTQTNNAITYRVVPDDGFFTVFTDVDPGLSEFSYAIFKQQPF